MENFSKNVNNNNSNGGASNNEQNNINTNINPLFYSNFGNSNYNRDNSIGSNNGNSAFNTQGLNYTQTYTSQVRLPDSTNRTTLAFSDIQLYPQVHSPTPIHVESPNANKKGKEPRPPPTSPHSDADLSSNASSKKVSLENNNSEAKAKKKPSKTGRRKVSQACVYCRRSHMTCDEFRPCSRCIKRKIGHLCHNESQQPHHHKAHSNAQSSSTQANTPNNDTPTNPPQQQLSSDASTVANAASSQQMQQTLSVPLTSNSLPPNMVYQPQSMGISESFSNSILSNQFNPLLLNAATPLDFSSQFLGNEFNIISDFLINYESNQLGGNISDQLTSNSNNGSNYTLINKPRNHFEPSNNKEKFFLTAADPKDGTRAERLREVLNAKYEAGLIKPFNYVNGYSKLQKYMDSNMSPTNRQRILNVISTFRPAFRQVALGLTDLDLVLVEEEFERLLLDYDRVFSSMGIPACLWRRTGEIYKGNQEFAHLIGIPVEKLKEGKICIYELMTEDSAVNYWEKYGNIAFDPGQKAVLSSCIFHLQSGVKGKEDAGFIGSGPLPTLQCCFSFTIRRDKYSIPIAIVGNFIPLRSSH